MKATALVQFRFAEAGHDFTPGSHRDRCQYAASGYCDGTRQSPEHERYRCGVCGSEDRVEHNDEMHAQEGRW